ncbi:MAG: CDP-alcohol phosphatidyltransferase family protein [Mycobacteriales bacterium]
MAGLPSPTGRVLTAPNALSLLRLLGIPLFLYLLLARRADGAAVAVLMVSGFTDYLDGRIARSWGQYSRLGALLDPLVDRLYVVATMVGLTLRHVVPLWVPVGLIARDVLLAGFLPVLRRRGYGPLPVHFLGKAATFDLLSGFPLVLLGAGRGPAAEIVRPVGWAFVLWGFALYWWAGVLYVVQARRLIAAPLEPAG